MLGNNLQALKLKFPNLAEKINDKSEKTIKYQLEETKNNSKTIKIANEETNKEYVYLHSKYDPEREAERIISKSELNNATIIVVMGFGLGYHILELFEKVKSTNKKLFVIEKNPLIIKEALKYHDFTSLLSSENFYLLQKEEIEDSEIFDFISLNIGSVFEKIEIIKLPAVFKCFSKYYHLALEQVVKCRNKLMRNQITTREDGVIWNQNILNNLDIIINSIGVEDIKTLGKGQPAIIVSAGPSLNKNINDLKKAKGKALIIAVNTSLKPLLNAGIIPDVVCVIDGNKEILKHFEGIDYSRLENVILAASPRVKPQVFRDWSGPIILTCIPGEDYIMRWIERYIGYKGRILSGGSVSHSAFGLAVYLEADPIVFVGQDLSFKSNNNSVNNTHVKGAIQPNRDDEDYECFQIEDIKGELVWTRRDYYNFLLWFNENIKIVREHRNEKKEFIDATEGGAKIAGTKVMRLQEAIKIYCQQEISLKDNLLDKVNAFKPYGIDRFVKELESTLTSLIEIKKIANKGLYLIDNMIESSSIQEGNIIQLKLERVNQKINKLKDNIILFESELYEFYLKDTNNDYKSANNLTLFNDFVDFYNKLIIGSDKVLKILKKKYKKII
ncbi:motility associated factor glycosyltransferase family protein [Orenia marismortui]|uniref:motility associated factor glycosyltransferase family protein n=1 Tax=Orenia marismortui TaxID=46469 RepID=UPI00037D95AF|nr:6-hydroxymethylpterin diphosphokinase MptE-like protein [Orenia marismortui]